MAERGTDSKGGAGLHSPQHVTIGTSSQSSSTRHSGAPVEAGSADPDGEAAR